MTAKETAEEILALPGVDPSGAITPRRIEQLKALAKAYLDMLEDEEVAECDVAGCENEMSSGGLHWSESGYWGICSQHGYAARQGAPRPTMKPEAMEREASRDPVTRFLPNRQASA